MSRVIIDSNVLVALLYKNDVWHKRASAILKAVNELDGDLIFKSLRTLKAENFRESGIKIS